MFSFLNRKTYQHLNKVTVSREALLSNHHALQKLHPETAICPVLKSNAYGHGLREISPILDSMKCPYLIVDSLFEAYELYKMKTRTPILIMGYTNPVNFQTKHLPFAFTIFDLETAKTLNEYQKGSDVHIFVDTGMNREGVTVDDLPEFLSQLKKYRDINIVGLYSHFADSANHQSDKFTRDQVKQFHKALEILRKSGINPKWRHISASAGSFKIKDPTFNMIRIGKAHYGINPLDENDPNSKTIKLTPVLEFSSTLVQIKKVPAGSSVGYGQAFKTTQNIVLGLLPAGYYEGIDRRLSSKGFVKIRDQFFPIIGRVSMNMTTIDITNLAEPKVGERVIVYSSNESDKNSIKNTALLVDTVPYDLMVHINETTKRFII